MARSVSEKAPPVVIPTTPTVEAWRAGGGDGPSPSLVPVLRGLLRQHFNGFRHAGGTLFAQVSLIVLPGG